MKKAVALAVLMALTTVVVTGQTTSGRTEKDQRVEEEIRNLNAQEVGAFLQNDVNTLAQLWSDNFVVTNPFNKFVTKQQVLGMVQSGMLAFTAYQRNIEYLKIYGETAIIAGSEDVIWAGKVPIAGKASHLRFTAVWMKQGQHWQEVARHANIVPQQ
jgi:ketosteroid isomerase-like protein